MPDRPSFPLPTTSVPAGQRCLQILVPDDPEHLAVLSGQILAMSQWFNWEKDPEHRAIEVSEVWRSVYYAVDWSGTGCVPEGCCEQFTPEQDYVAFWPQDPFTTPDYVPPGYILPPFYSNPLIALPGVLPTDAILNFLALPILENLSELLTTGLPRARINFTGSGQVEIEMIKLPQGGFAALTLDGDNDTMQVVNLAEFGITDLDDLSELVDVLIQGLVQTEIVEFNVVTDGSHFIEVTFLPNVGLDIIVGFGGGIRSIEFCNGTAPGEAFAMQMDTIPGEEEGCTVIRWRPNSGSAWLPLTEICNGEAAPPVNFGFDAASCALKYTQGNIASPYTGEGSEWITVFDWNNTDLRECLGLGSGAIIPPDTGIDVNLCAIAWGSARYFIDDLLLMYDRHLLLGDTYIGPGVIGDMLLEGGFWFDWSWFLSLASVVSAWNTPSVGNRDVIDAPDVLCKVAEAFYNAMATVDDVTTLDKAAWQTNIAAIDTAVANVNAALVKWADVLSYLSSASRLNEYFLKASFFATEEDCMEFDCDPGLGYTLVDLEFDGAYPGLSITRQGEDMNTFRIAADASEGYVSVIRPGGLLGWQITAFTWIVTPTAGAYWDKLLCDGSPSLGFAINICIRSMNIDTSPFSNQAWEYEINVVANEDL